MPYILGPKTKLVYAMLDKRISEEDFFRDFPATKESMGSVVLGLLERALSEKNPDCMECAIPLAYHYGLSNDYLHALNTLALELWHFRHEDVVFALGLLKDPSSIEVLSKAALANHPYLENDEFFALGTKAVHALEHIQTPEAIQAMGDLAKNENQIISGRALERLKTLVKKGETESARTMAQSTLETLHVTG